jgi:hypothetical protein
MELGNLQNLAFKAPATETADVQSLLRARVNGNGHARAGGNGGNGHRRRVRHQILHGVRRAALKADTAVMLVEDGMDVAQAVTRCDTSLDYFYAMKALRESGNVALHNAVLHAGPPVRAAAKLVKNAAMVITAYQKCSALERELVRLATGATADPVTMLLNLTPDQLVAVANALGTEWIWNTMISPVVSAEPNKTVVAEPATRSMTETEVKMAE